MSSVKVAVRLRPFNSRETSRGAELIIGNVRLWSLIPGDQPELSKCMMLLLLKYKRKLVGDGLELKRIAERLLI